MITWRKTTNLTHGQTTTTETWTLYEDEHLIISFDVNIRKGKPFRSIKAKPINLDSLKSYANNNRKEVGILYKRKTTSISICPCCGASTRNTKELVAVFDRPYHLCSQCEYVFLKDIPTPESLDQHFIENEHLSSTYTSLDQEQIRLDEIVYPKLDWACNNFKKLRCRQPKNILDIGAGAGHFVYGARQKGFDADGYEINRQCIDFAKNTFAVKLHQKSFLEQHPGSQTYDLITMWGLIEYTPNPQQFVQKAREFLNPDGMLVIEVPRYHSASTAIQSAYPDYVFRHLSPDSHISIFSDASLATLLHTNGFQITDAWLFGMDAYELMVQMCLMTGAPTPDAITQKRVDTLQRYFDRASFSDDIILCAVKKPS